ncbi:hypothetical protein JZU61_04555 [bacterium]|nr:hypothetical protein [bacterium]
MAMINFKEFKVYQNMAKTEMAYFDIRMQLSDLLFKKGDGMLAHTLCHLIFDSDGEVELDTHQFGYLMKFANENCTPAVIETLLEFVK